ncbi:hypothetical protein EVJ58_g10685 [Rhodofomes roseus]|uniref:Uncharacterized protein n=1 Tax=Rhodofomes roseus TaxID=34475 RepID=A0A4Y9XPA6_9APHY|nr:hypothetical protein EVJ58_g10685 [Rhodofomes roseus]
MTPTTPVDKKAYMVKPPPKPVPNPQPAVMNTAVDADAMIVVAYDNDEDSVMSDSDSVSSGSNAQWAGSQPIILPSPPMLNFQQSQPEPMVYMQAQPQFAPSNSVFPNASQWPAATQSPPQSPFGQAQYNPPVVFPQPPVEAFFGAVSVPNRDGDVAADMEIDDETPRSHYHPTWVHCKSRAARDAYRAETKRTSKKAFRLRARRRHNPSRHPTRRDMRRAILAARSVAMPQRINEEKAWEKVDEDVHMGIEVAQAPKTTRPTSTPTERQTHPVTLTKDIEKAVAAPTAASEAPKTAALPQATPKARPASDSIMQGAKADQASGSSAVPPSPRSATNAGAASETGAATSPQVHALERAKASTPPAKASSEPKSASAVESLEEIAPTIPAQAAEGKGKGKMRAVIVEESFDKETEEDDDDDDDDNDDDDNDISLQVALQRSLGGSAVDLRAVMEQSALLPPHLQGELDPSMPGPSRLPDMTNTSPRAAPQEEREIDEVRQLQEEIEAYFAALKESEKAGVAAQVEQQSSTTNNTPSVVAGVSEAREPVVSTPASATGPKTRRVAPRVRPSSGVPQQKVGSVNQPASSPTDAAPAQRRSPPASAEAKPASVSSKPAASAGSRTQAPSNAQPARSEGDLEAAQALAALAFTKVIPKTPVTMDAQPAVSPALAPKTSPVSVSVTPQGVQPAEKATPKSPESKSARPTRTIPAAKPTKAAPAPSAC